MVSPQALLALGIGLPLLAIGAYVAWLAGRVRELEHRLEAPSPPEAKEGSEESE